MSQKKFEELDILRKYLNFEHEPSKKFIFLGGESNLCKNLVQIYTQAIQKQKKTEVFEEISVNGLEASPNEFYTELFTVPLFASKRIITVKHADLLFKGIESEPTTMKYFKHAFKNWPTFTFCFLQFDSSSIPKKFVDLEQSSILFRQSIPKGDNLIRYYSQKAKAMGCDIDHKSLELFISKCAWDFYKTQQIFDQLILHITPSQKGVVENIKITKEIVEEFCTNWSGDFYFEILDHIAEKKINRCITKLHQHNFDDGLEFSGSFTKLFIDSYRYHHFKKLGLSSSETLERLNMSKAHPFMIKKNQERYQRLMMHYSEKSILLVFKYLNRLDESLKVEPKEKHLALLTMFFASLQDC